MKKIGTHDGTFHCDEVLACFMLRQLPEYAEAEIVRSRNPNILETCDIVVDVGGIFDPKVHRYDHHQRNFDETMNSLNEKKKWVTKLSSAGLIYAHFGHRVIAQVLKLKPDEKIIDKIYDKMYANFVEEVDGIDNGIESSSGDYRYKISTNLSSRVSFFNPNWTERNVDVQARFDEAYKLVGTEFMDRIKFYALSWWPAREIVEKTFDERYEVDSSGEIMWFKSGGVPWKDHLFGIEEEQLMVGTIKYVLFEDQNGKWRVQCVPQEDLSFENRLSLPEPWRGVRDDELSALSGIDGCIFVHSSGFIGGNATYEGVLKMARFSLKNSSQP